MFVNSNSTRISELERENAMLHERNEMLMNRLESTLQRRPSKVIENVLIELRKVSHETPSEASFGILRTARRALARKEKKRLRWNSQQLFLQVNETPDLKSLLPSLPSGCYDMVKDIAARRTEIEMRNERGNSSA